MAKDWRCGKRRGGGSRVADLRTIDDMWPELVKTAASAGLKPWELERLTPVEFEAIQEGDRIRDKRSWQRTALLCAVIANCNRDKKKKPSPYKAADFMPREQKAQTPEQMLEIMKGLAASQKGGGRRG